MDTLQVILVDIQQLHYKIAWLYGIEIALMCAFIIFLIMIYLYIKTTEK